MLQFMGSQRVGHNCMTELKIKNKNMLRIIYIEMKKFQPCLRNEFKRAETISMDPKTKLEAV